MPNPRRRSAVLSTLELERPLRVMSYNIKHGHGNDGVVDLDVLFQYSRPTVDRDGVPSRERTPARDCRRKRETGVAMARRGRAFTAANAQCRIFGWKLTNRYVLRRKLS